MFRHRVDWAEIDCDAYQAALNDLGDDRFVHSSDTDMAGLRNSGNPRSEIVWARKTNPVQPQLMTVRHPGADGGPDRAPCQHWQATTTIEDADDDA